LAHKRLQLKLLVKIPLQFISKMPRLRVQSSCSPVLFQFFCGWLIVFLFISCAEETSKVKTTSEVLEIIRPKYAKGFEIHIYENQTEILLYNLEKKGDTLDLVTISRSSDLLASTGCMSTTHLPFMKSLGLTNLVSGCGNAQWVKNADFKNLIHSGKIINLSKGDALDAELLLASGAKILFTYPFGDTYIDSEKIPDVELIPISEYLEEHPLGRAEWIKVFGAIYGKKAAADSAFSSIEKTYLDVQHNSQKNTRPGNPKVLTASVQGDRWFVPPGNSYIGHLIEDAGGDFLYKDSIASSNYSFNQEAFFALLMNTEVYTEVNMDPSLTSIEKLIGIRPFFGAIPAVLSKKIYFCNSSKTDYFGDAVLEPHIIIQDFAAAFYPDQYPDYRPKYFEKLED
jgi:iron complex transport system substrate-binding protein